MKALSFLGTASGEWLAVAAVNQRAQQPIIEWNQGGGGLSECRRVLDPAEAVSQRTAPPPSVQGETDRRHALDSLGPAEVARAQPQTPTTVNHCTQCTGAASEQLRDKHGTSTGQAAACRAKVQIPAVSAFSSVPASRAVAVSLISWWFRS